MLTVGYLSRPALLSSHKLSILQVESVGLASPALDMKSVYRSQQVFSCRHTVYLFFTQSLLHLRINQRAGISSVHFSVICAGIKHIATMIQAACFLRHTARTTSQTAMRMYTRRNISRSD
ncbi:hypothetical protein HBI56_054760 [Parastagonospora nodorum]|nr:hypothetical protein HBH53_147730 [Parastagonospora nodorum]KAH3967059.1 hypothetical protein HBH51_139140 [Parastagonospora nodorum]KAH3981222.1 hypothetical protein HBH52_085180 [Parastagonospora nodorum]KAH4260319.1 hypothetical protein HBI03_124460 [Parastagonospora nodorum]KAH4306700.1 hypothetical protein HBI02_118920 [Parastagonospora nodorum]